MQTPNTAPTPAAGSDSELVAALLRGAAQQRFIVANALRHELLSLANASDAVATVKITWWYDELRRASAGNARHPLTDALAATTGQQSSDWSIFEEYLVLVESWLRGERPTNLEECRVAMFRQYAPALYWCFDAATAASAEASGTVHHVAIAAGFADSALALINQASPPLVSLPTEWTDTHWQQDRPARMQLVQSCVAAGQAELAACSQSTHHETTTAVIAALTRGKLRAAKRNRSAGKFMQLLRAWRSVRRVHKRLRNNDDN
ncbi:MAG: hypothetical protein AAGH76_09740 [Pseudomonadota bacterium]